MQRPETVQGVAIPTKLGQSCTLSVRNGTLSCTIRPITLLLGNHFPR
jgi:hypothetical protein